MRAILSVYDKTGVVDFARGLGALGFELFSTGGTEALLREAGVDVRGVQELKILSVYDKTGVVDFARGLGALGFELFSTGGTEALLREAGVDVRGVQEL